MNFPCTYMPPVNYYERNCDCFAPGDHAPGFTLDAVVRGEQRKVSLSDYKGKWVVLFFYGSDFTFV